MNSKRSNVTIELASNKKDGGQKHPIQISVLKGLNNYQDWRIIEIIEWWAIEMKKEYLIWNHLRISSNHHFFIFSFNLFNCKERRDKISYYFLKGKK